MIHINLLQIYHGAVKCKKCDRWGRIAHTYKMHPGAVSYGFCSCAFGRRRKEIGDEDWYPYIDNDFDYGVPGARGKNDPARQVAA